MTLPTFTLRQMVEAGVHFGHHARRWNPSMAPYIYGKKDNIHIIDLQKTYPMLYTALNAAREVAAQGGKILFVGTKRQAQDLIKENAERCGQYYVNHRWLGGMLTNWKTVYKSISRLVKLNEMFEKNAFDGYTKKEMQNIKKEQEKLNKELGGIMNMGGQPDMLFVIDTPKEDLAIKEAKKLGIPVIGICDTNANPNEVDFPVPGNDDAIRAIQFYCELVSSAVLDGMQAEIAAQGVKVEEAVENIEAKPAKKRTAKKRCVDRSLCGIKLWRRERRILFWISCIFSGFECQRTDRDSIGKAKPEGQNKKEFYSSEKTRKKRNSMEGKEFAYGRNIAAARSCHRNTLKISWNRRRTKEKEKAGRGTAIILPTIGYHLGFADWSWDAGIQGMGENGKPLQERGYGKECSI